MRWRTGLRVAAAAAVVLLLAALPRFGPGFLVEVVVTRALFLGTVASTIVFLARYGGMTSLGQILFFGVAGFMYGNAVSESGARGLNLGWSPFVGIVFALAVATALGLLLGAVGSRATGIYYLMLTLVYAVIGYQVFFNVQDLSGQSGITSITPPGFASTPVAVYYTALVLSVLAYAGFKAIGRTNFGLALQGVRDDPVRMASLGFNVPLTRTLAFTLAAFVAATAGLVFVWWNGQIDPASINIGPAIALLIVAVVGGISSFEGAWLGAIVYAAAEVYIRELPLVDRIGLTPDRFNTLIGLLVLLIMVLSPEGLAGIFTRVRTAAGGRGTTSMPIGRTQPVGADPAGTRPQIGEPEPQPARTAGPSDTSLGTDTKGTIL